MRSESLSGGHWDMTVAFFSPKEGLEVGLGVLLAGAVWMAPARVRKGLLAKELDCSSERTLVESQLYECFFLT